ncbi:stalk domain-containing protein [Aminipila terrae]|uniref:Copper amine oxidase-like N-terminal domain-containing protein n=1 Tax=Aminipila terrae TaxID=2697030 RepID=A0A6P1ME35_9FIRM|nr:stalk domain-containing protein [Aminipila terrae]QHI71393.1 hypothetical protein Ami3637_02445 [Aminipila terrae]
MKRKIQIALCMLLCSVIFFGCSSNELGYLDLCKEMSNIKSCQFSGTAEIYYDADAIKEFIAKYAEDEYLTEDLEKDFSKFTGKKKIELLYSGSGETSDTEGKYELDIKARIDGREGKLGKLYISSTEGIYIERDMLINLYQLSRDLFTDYKNSYFYSTAYEKELRNALGTSEYIQLFNPEDALELEDESSFDSSVYNSADFTNKTMEFIKDIFKGYTSGTVTSIPGGYSVSADGDRLIQIASECLGYMGSNIDDIINSFLEFTSYMEKLQGIESDEENMKISDADRAEMAGQIAAIKTQLDYMHKKGELDFIKPFSYNQTVKKSGNVYTCEQNLSMNTNSKDLFYIKSKSTMESKKVDMKFPVQGTDISAISQNISKLEDKYNPVKKVEISWEKSRETAEDGYDYCDIYYTRKSASPLSQEKDYDWGEYQNLNKQMYVPLRQICEYFGEEVGWDNQNKIAYVVRDGKKIKINGIYDTETVFVKARDFEKLGYKVNYNGSNPDTHLVTIEKN